MKPECLPFPLNVYALTLQQEYEQVDHLHFGVCDEHSPDGEDYPSAQQRAQDDLCSLLPPAPASILEIGFGTGTLARTLANDGYLVTAVTCIAEEFYGVVRDEGAVVNFIHSSLPALKPSQRFDVVLLQQSAQYMDPLELLALADESLKEGGQLLIADEFTLDDSEIRPEPRPLLASFLQLAERCGFTTQRQRELGRQVAPGLREFIALMVKHRSALVEQCGLQATQLVTLIEGLGEIASKYEEARLAYTLLDLRKESGEGQQRRYGSINAFTVNEIPALFEKSFEAPFDSEIWHWKYGNGRGRAVCVRNDKQLLAHYGGAPRDILYFDKKSKALQICDVMVLPKHRSFVSRDTLFFKTAATLLEQQVGNCAEHLLGFGFPNQRVLRVAQRLGLYDVTDRFIEIDYPMDEHDSVTVEYAVRTFDHTAVGAKSHVNALWQTMAINFKDKIIGVRDWGYLQYRYFTHPLWIRGEYECLEIRGYDESTPCALAFLKPHEGGRLLMDLIGDVQAFPEILTALRDHLSQRSLGLRCRVTEAHASTLSLERSKHYELGIEIPCNIWTRGPAANTLQGAWWLTAGDMDFL